MMFSLSLCGLGAIIMTISLSYSRRNVNDIFDETQRISIFHVETLTVEWLSQGPVVLDMMTQWLQYHGNTSEVDLFLRSDISNATMDRVIRYVCSLVKTGNLITAVAYVSKNGGGAGCQQKIGATDSPFNGVAIYSHERAEVCCPYTFSDLMNGSLPIVRNIGPLRLRKVNDDFTLGPPVGAGLSHYDFRLFKWYTSLIDSKDTYHWGSNVNTMGDISIACSRKFYDHSNTFMGANTIHFFLQHGFEGFLQKLQISRGLLFMINQDDGMVIASSNEDTQLVHYDESVGISSPSFIDDVDCVIIRDSCTYMIDQVGSLEAITQLYNQEFRIEGDDYVLEAKQAEVIGGLKILIVHVTPKSVVFDSIYEGNTRSILLSIAFIIVVAVFSWIAICVILSPLVLLTQKMKKIEKIEKLDKIIFPVICSSPFREIRNVERRFKVLVKKLIEYSAFLPDSVKTEFSKDEKIKRRRFSIHPLQDYTFPALPFEDLLPPKDEKKPNGSIVSDDFSTSTASSISSESNNSYSNGTEDSEREGSDTLIVTKDKFGLGISRKVIVCLYLYFVNWKSIYEGEGPFGFSEKYSQIFDLISSTVQKFGMIHRFNIDGTLIIYTRSNLIHAINNLIRIRTAVNSRRYSFSVIFVLCMERTLFGVIGHSKLKTNCLFDGVAEKSRFTIENYLSSSRIQAKIQKEEDKCFEESVVLLENSVEEEVRFQLQIGRNLAKLVYIPFDVFVNVNNPSGYEYKTKTTKNDGDGKSNQSSFLERLPERVIVYEVVSFPAESVGREREWMYALDEENKEKRRRFYLHAFFRMLKGDVEQTKKYLKLYKGQRVPSTSTTQNNNNMEEEEEEERIIEMEGYVEEEKLHLDFSVDSLCSIVGKIERGEFFSFEDFMRRNTIDIEFSKGISHNLSVMFSAKEKREALGSKIERVADVVDMDESESVADVVDMNESENEEME